MALWTSLMNDALVKTQLLAPGLRGSWQLPDTGAGVGPGAGAGVGAGAGAGAAVGFGAGVGAGLVMMGRGAGGTVMSERVGSSSVKVVWQAAARRPEARAPVTVNTRVRVTPPPFEKTLTLLH